MSIRDLKVGFRVYGGTVQAVDLQYLSLQTGETLALVGETGCGKSVTARAILRLLPPGKAVVSGSIVISLVMSLPTVGPVLLRALVAQDMFLAGTIILLLGVLTVVGTLISDLVLMWIDPRVRAGIQG